MSITFVTAFLHGSDPKRSYEQYRQHFDALARTGVPIVLFLDARSTWTFPKNVCVEPVLLKDTWAGKYIPDAGILPPQRGSKDTIEYMRIQNTKPEWLYRAMFFNPFHTDWFAWVDFGIAHVFRHPAETFERIRLLRPPKRPCIKIAGIWRSAAPVFDSVNWRFAGGFLLAHRSRIEDFYIKSCECISKNLPYVAWEVNVWARMESEGFPFEWYASDHNDTIIPSNPEQEPRDPLEHSQ